MRRRSNQKREKYIMLASSLFVLSALTLTGFYVKERNKIEEENSVDFSKLENSPADKVNEIYDSQIKNQQPVQEANTAKAINPKLPNTTANTASQDRYQFSGVPIVTAEDNDVEQEEDKDKEETPKEEEKQETAAPARTLKFMEDEALAWPVVGNFLINYSMDKTV